MGGFFYLPSVYLAKGAVLTAEDSLSLKKHQILISSEKCKAGVYLVKILRKKSVLKEMFLLEGKDKYTLVFRNNGLYIGEKKKSLHDTASETIKRPGRKSVNKPVKEIEKKSEEKWETKPKKVIKNASKKKISVRADPRYLFVWEIESYTEEKWREELLAGCKIWYGDQKKEEIIFQWHWNGLLQNSAGSYQVEVSVKGGERTVIPVTLVQESTKEEKTGYVRFQNSDTENATHVENGKYEPEEVWHFDRQDIQDVKKYMKKREDPFSSETNREFLVQFQRCRIRRGS